ncbi:hypothetical protein [Stenotrophomonas sp.]|uniref:hypothetical protein n=1 Tax=Stenotrophomonas sp. TaxID=69392 RepID=UPI002FC8CE3D
MERLGKRAVVRRGVTFFLVCLACVNGLVPLDSFGADAEAFYVDDADAVRDGCDRVATRERQFSCHRIAPGDGVVVAVREYRRSRRTDGATYSKVTVRLPADAAAGDTFALGDGQVRVFFSSGPSAFAGKKGCYGEARQGQVSVKSFHGGKMVVKVSAEIPLTSPLDWKGDCDVPKVVDATIRASLADIRFLNAWQGRPGSEDTPFEEANVMD